MDTFGIGNLILSLSKDEVSAGRLAHRRGADAVRAAVFRFGPRAG